MEKQCWLNPHNSCEQQCRAFQESETISCLIIFLLLQLEKIQKILRLSENEDD